MEDILRYVDEHLPEYVERFRTYLRFPSVAAQNRGQEVCATWLRDQMIQAGFDARLEPTKGGPPVVMGERKQPGAKRTLLVYGHYDVQPAEPLEEWHHDPFGAEIVNDRIYGRGAVDEKGGSLATLIAAEVFLKIRGSLPVNLRFAIEGEEEVGSVHLGQWVEDHVDFMRADGSLTLDGSVNRSTGRPQINPGWRAGILAVELHSRGASQDLYSAEAHYVPNAAWRLVWALSTLKNEREEILIEGWYDDLLRPTENDLKLIREFPFDAEAMAKQLGLKELLLGRKGHAPLIARWYEPTCTICGIQSGYTGKGMMTKVPSTAFAKVDFRLKTGMDPDRHVKLLRRHLDQHGFSDIEIKILGAKYAKDKTPLDSTIVKATRQAATEAFGVAPLLFPEVDIPNQYPNGSYWALGPGSLADAGTGAIGAIGVPWVECYYGDPESFNHAPNEFLSIAAFKRAIHYAARTIELFAVA
jgi:acetylornithine deacetylase/succinyl-diaminopimelate desuccinylase-like protein